MTTDANADFLGDQIAAAVPGLSIVACQRLLKEMRDKATVRGIVREWLNRIEKEPVK